MTYECVSFTDARRSLETENATLSVTSWLACLMGVTATLGSIPGRDAMPPPMASTVLMCSAMVNVTRLATLRLVSLTAMIVCQRAVRLSADQSTMVTAVTTTPMASVTRDATMLAVAGTAETVRWRTNADLQRALSILYS